MSLEQEFQGAAARAKSLPAQSDEVLLQLYGLYKQATSGDVAGDEPGMFDFVGRAKYDAWAGHRGTARDEAMRAYVALVDRLAAGS
jgi:carboxylesterase